MRTLLQAGIAVAVALGLCASAEAQSRGRHMTPLRVSTPVRTARGSQFQIVSGTTAGDFFLLSDAASLSLTALSTGTFPVPGLGFDYAHLAAVTRNLRVSDISVLSTAQRLALARSLTPVVPFGGAFIPTPAQVIVVQQPPVVVVQQSAMPEDELEPVARTRPAQPRETVERARAPEPLHDAGEFVLVRRDGRLVFAVAFFAEGDQLTYITREGVRRALPLAELDIETTRRMNEERGTTIHLPV
ncbi:MAG: hypothetical protein WAR21_02940 [Candidatus Acidiferrales bacterium]